MKSKIIILAIFAIALGVYLNRAYVFIYSSLGEKNLPNPTVNMNNIISPSSGNPSANITYVALGDSLTAGVGASKEENSYPYRMAKLIAEKKNMQVTLVNLGVPGATAADVLKDQIPLVAKLHPDFVTLSIGVNDMHNRVPDISFRQTLSSIVDSLFGITKHINILTIPYIGDKSIFLPPYRQYFDWQTNHYNSLLHNALVGRDVTIIDLYGLTRERAFSDPNYYSADGFHPSDDGYNFWSTILYDHLDY